jgi:hypothetical protein
VILPNKNLVVYCQFSWFLGLLVLFSGCEKSGRFNNIPEESELLGVWELQDNGEEHFSFTHLALLPNNRRCVVTYDVYGKTTKLNGYISTWSLQETAIVTVFGPNSAGFEPGYMMKDEITDYYGHRMDLLMVEPMGSDLEIHRKLVEVDPNRICQLARKIISSQSHSISGAI